MGMYLVAPPIALLVVAFVPAIVMGLASRMARRADWLETKAAEATKEEADNSSEATQN